MGRMQNRQNVLSQLEDLQNQQKLQTLLKGKKIEKFHGNLEETSFEFSTSANRMNNSASRSRWSMLLWSDRNKCTSSLKHTSARPARIRISLLKKSTAQKTRRIGGNSATRSSRDDTNTVRHNWWTLYPSRSMKYRKCSQRDNTMTVTARASTNAGRKSTRWTTASGGAELRSLCNLISRRISSEI